MASKKSKAVELDVELNEQVQEDSAPASINGYNADLVATLEKYPHIDCVFINENGEWHFAEKAGFTAVTREQILNG